MRITTRPQRGDAVRYVASNGDFGSAWRILTAWGGWNDASDNVGYYNDTFANTRDALPTARNVLTKPHRAFDNLPRSFLKPYYSLINLYRAFPNPQHSFLDPHHSFLNLHSPFIKSHHAPAHRQNPQNPSIEPLFSRSAARFDTKNRQNTQKLPRKCTAEPQISHYVVLNTPYYVIFT